MKNLLPLLIVLATVSGLALPVTSLAQPAQTGAEQSRVIRVTRDLSGTPQHIALALNQAVVVELDRDVRDVVVANPAIADAVVKTPRRIFLMSLKSGQTNALLLDAQGAQIADLQISVASNVGDLNDQLARQLPGAHVHAEALGDSVVLSGYANTVQQAAQADALAQRMVVPPNKVVNNISIGQRQQVLIQVRVSEMSRAISKQLGINLLAVGSAGGVPIVLQTDNQFSLVGRALSNMIGSLGNTSYASCVATHSQMCPITTTNTASGVLQALEQVGLVHTLAEPNLTAVSGEAAKFLAGGEFPVPVSHDLTGNITVEYKPFGVGLSFTPVVLSEGRISLQISTEVSELTNTGAFTLNGGVNSQGQAVQGLTLPALSVRRTETTVELPSGGSLAIGGLIQQQTKQNLDGLPGVKDLPVLGALFRSRDFQNNETELVVTVTAYLVNPVAPAQLAGPDDGFAPASDLDTILRGRVNAVYGRDAKPAAEANTLGYAIP